MIRIRISEDALQDLNDGFLFYEAQEAGLGDYFISCKDHSVITGSLDNRDAF